MHENYQIYIVKGTIINKSPLIIGTGKGGETADLELIKNENGDFYIPGTSLAGALKHHIHKNYDITKINPIEWNSFWGSSDDNLESNFIIDDAIPVDSNKNRIKIRDGISINNKTGIAKDKAKYDYELLEPGCRFQFNVELVVPENFEKVFSQILFTIISDLKSGNILLGAMTTKGFGKIKLVEEKIYHFQFPNDSKKWFMFLENSENVEGVNITSKDINNKLPPEKRNILRINAQFSIKNSLIIGTYPTNVEDPDKVHLTSGENFVVPGTSWKGVIRARAEKILKTLDSPYIKDLSDLFGDKKKEGNKDVLLKSRFFVEESPIENAEEMLHTRIKIDRFTGGTIEGALFESKPLWHNNETITLKLKIVDVKEWEVGLMLLILKDLWLGDLAIGGEKNIGRGVLQGIKAEITKNNCETYIITECKNGELTLEGPENCYEKLEAYVKKIMCKGDCKNE